MKKATILILLVSAAISAATQPADFAAGLLFEDETYDTLPRLALENGAKTDLPTAVDLTPYCPEVRHQGYIFSCVGWATGYGAMSIQRAVLNGCTDRAVITRNAHSALFLYNQIKPGDCEKGSRISDALQFLSENGDCLARQFDFDVNDCERLPDTALLDHARRFAIADYLTLFGSKEAPEAKVLRTRQALSAKRPVVVGLAVLRNFYELKNAQFWHPHLGNTAPAGGHALVVVGYDDRKEAFRLFNSWGKNWGDGGYIWLKYKDFGDFCKYAYLLHLAGSQRLDTSAAVPVAVNLSSNFNPPPPAANVPSSTAHRLPSTVEEKPLAELAGDFTFRHLTGWSQLGQPVFENAPVALHGNVYRLQNRPGGNGDWQVGQLFQLLAATLRDDEYLYVFSVDARREVHFHYPRQAGLNEKFAGQNESGLLLAGGAQVVVPGETKALKLAHPGTDRLVVLFSKRKIQTVKKLAETLSRKEGDFMQNLLATLGKYAVPQADITYAADRMGFEAATRSEGFIVPLVLEVEAKN